MYFLHKWLVEYEVPDIKIDVLKMYFQHVPQKKAQKPGMFLPFLFP